MDIWRERLAGAHAEYENAKRALEKATAAGDEVRARQRMLAARAEYLRLLKVFSDIVLGARKVEAREPGLYTR